MMIAYILFSFAVAAALQFVPARAVRPVAALFYAAQAALAVWICCRGFGQPSSSFFLFDAAGTLMFLLMALVSPVAYYHACDYLEQDAPRDFRLFTQLLVLLCTAIAAVYFASNIAVTWIFLEATTLCAAGLVYHRHADGNLEATWKYIFVCSTGIAMAYLGVLLLCGMSGEEGLSYQRLAETASRANPLYLKVAFLLILAGYSCKMEIFPLYTIGVDANYSAPAPASALLSTVLVNAGFLSIFRVYKVMASSEVFPWVCNVLIVTGVLSLLVGALFLRRTNHCKRFLSYSTVENMGIVAIGLGIGGAGVWAALFHVVGHTLIKSGLFLQIARVRKSYGSYRINRLGDYMNISKTGAVTMIVGTLLLLAFPPSPLFLSEVKILGGTIGQGKWWLTAVMLLLLCIVIYGVWDKVLKLCYRPAAVRPAAAQSPRRLLSLSALFLLLCAIALGVWQPAPLADLIHGIATF